MHRIALGFARSEVSEVVHRVWSDLPGVARAVVGVALFGLVSCGPAETPAPPPVRAALPPPPPMVLDAFSAKDRTFLYMDGRAMRQAILPDLLRAVSALRADVQ